MGLVHNVCYFELQVKRNPQYGCVVRENDFLETGFWAYLISGKVSLISLVHSEIKHNRIIV